jgi:hypothetical protein
MITAQAKRNTPNLRRRVFTLIGALPPAAITYTHTAGEPGKSPALELEMPAEPELRRNLQRAEDKALKRQNTGGRPETAPFQGNTAMTARTGTYCANPAPEPSFA